MGVSTLQFTDVTENFAETPPPPKVKCTVSVTLGNFLSEVLSALMTAVTDREKSSLIRALKAPFVIHRGEVLDGAERA